MSHNYLGHESNISWDGNVKRQVGLDTTDVDTARQRVNNDLG
jgi:hypothetical protein